MRSKRMTWVLTLTATASVFAVVALQSCAGTGGGADVSTIARERGLTEADIVAAVKTFQPTGKKDEYILFGSGGHSGQVVVIGVPSMRLLKVIAVFTSFSSEYCDRSRHISLLHPHRFVWWSYRFDTRSCVVGTAICDHNNGRGYAQP